MGEGEVLAAVRLGHRAVFHREVAHVQLVDHHVGGRGDARRGRAVPAGGLERRRAQIGDVAAAGVGRQAERVRVGHAVAHQAHARHVHVDQVGVAGAGAAARHARLPAAGERIEAHRVQGARLCLRVAVQAHGHMPRRGRPKAKAGFARRHGDTQVAQLPGRGIEVVQRTRGLKCRRPQHAALVVFLHQPGLRTVQRDQLFAAALRQREHRAGREVLETLRQRRGHEGGLKRQRQIGPAYRLTGPDVEAAVACGVQLEAPCPVGTRPLHEAPGQPHRARLVDGRRRLRSVARPGRGAQHRLEAVGVAVGERGGRGRGTESTRAHRPQRQPTPQRTAAPATNPIHPMSPKGPGIV